jgi:RNA polymerase sigma-70 factor (ECF subfamily)
MVNDKELLTQLKTGNSKAFAELVALYQKKVLNICYRFLMNRADAEDVSQEVFLEIYHSLANFKENSKLSTWIYRIAVSKSLDELKKQSRKKRISSIGKTLGLEKVVPWVAAMDRPDKAMEENEDLEILMKALNKLHESQRIALTLSKIEGYTNSEVAEIMQISLTAVDSLIYRAKQNLRIFLNK